MIRRSLTIETKDRPHVVMYGMTRHVADGKFEDREDTHYLPVTSYDDMSTIEINRKQLGWAVVGYGHLDKIVDELTGRVRKDIVQMQRELDLLINSPEAKLGANYEASLRAEIEARVRAEIEAERKDQPKVEAKNERAGRAAKKGEGNLHEELSGAREEAGARGL